MPELPEVEAARRLVERECCGKVITRVCATEQGGGARSGTFDDLICDGITSAKELEDALTGRSIVRSCRKGKQMWWILSGKGKHPTWHFGMTGAFCCQLPNGDAIGPQYQRLKVGLEVWPPKFTKVEVEFADGTKLAFTDFRRLGRVRLQTDPEHESPIAELGPDPSQNMVSLEAFTVQLRKRASPIKAMLLDQAFLAGIGNWLADECLYQARIHPETYCCALSDEEIRRLYDSILHVVTFACGVEADSSKFPAEWLFHARWGKGKKAATTSDGHAITFVTVGGRTSAIVSAVQTGPRKTAWAATATTVVEDADPKKIRKATAVVGKAASDAAASLVTATAAGSKRKGRPASNTAEDDSHETKGKRVRKSTRA